MQSLKQMRKEAHDEARRKMKATSVDVLAEVAGVSAPTYLKYENDPKLFTLGQASKLAKYLGCSIEDIFFDEEDN